jgi:hypothetical protein
MQIGSSSHIKLTWKTIAGTGMSLDSWAQFNSELQFVAENDEHADIAAGDQIIDESLVNEALSHTEPSAETLEAETQSTEPIVNSVLHDQLVSVKARLETEIKLHGKPLCYKRGDFFDRPPHPVFALNEAMKSRLDPAKLYQRQVFVWLPHLLPGGPDRF